MRSTLPTLLACVVVLACGAGAPEPPGPPPNVVILLVDTLRADHTSLYGYARETTPTLGAIAKGGLVARNHFSNAPWTKPSVGSILTGLHPSAHGSRTGQFEQLHRYDELVAAGRTPSVEILSDRHTTLAEHLRAAGYRTSILLSNPHLSEKFGYAQGFDEYALLHDEPAIDRTIEQLGKNDGPVFVWCHLMGVHEYWAPEGEARFRSVTSTPLDPNALQVGRVRKYASLEEAVDAYDNSILYADSLLAKLFSFIEAEAPNTLLIVTSDHGEEFYEHGGFEHVNTLYNEILSVPLVFWGPGVPFGEVAGLSDTTDLLPTVLGALGLPIPKGLDGRRLYDEDGPRTGKTAVFAEQHHRGPTRRFALIRPDAKLIVSIPKSQGEERLELYPRGTEIERDPVPSPASAVRYPQLRDAIEATRRANAAYFDENVGTSTYEHLTKEELRQLEALGYVEP